MVYKVGDLIQYQGCTGVIVKENKQEYFICWLHLESNKTYAYLKAYHSRSFIKVS